MILKPHILWYNHKDIKIKHITKNEWRIICLYSMKSTFPFSTCQPKGKTQIFKSQPINLHKIVTLEWGLLWLFPFFLSLGLKFGDINHKALMGTLTYEPFFVISRDLEDNSAAVYLHNLAFAPHFQSYRCR